ncbi:hypothetical protein ACPPVV_15360 [Rhodanobacter sp. Col0626]|uniref:hypothetical protein n=1 Tax=Rhodanobacter sp. Col0626 TaxID=3415679 RepID=UPI003CF57EFA
MRVSRAGGFSLGMVSRVQTQGHAGFSFSDRQILSSAARCRGRRDGSCPAADLGEQAIQRFHRLFDQWLMPIRLFWH